MTDYTKDGIKAAVLAALQAADEMMADMDTADYVDLMASIAAECKRRANAAMANARRVDYSPLVVANTGGGCEAFEVTNANDAPNWRVWITCDDDPSIPEAPWMERMAFGVYDEEGDQYGPCEYIEGREGLNQWYLDNVGYSPDQEADQCNEDRPTIYQLMHDVAEMMLLQAYQDMYHARNSRA